MQNTKLVARFARKKGFDLHTKRSFYRLHFWLFPPLREGGSVVTVYVFNLTSLQDAGRRAELRREARAELEALT